MIIPVLAKADNDSVLVVPGGFAPIPVRPGSFRPNARHFGTGTIRYQDTSALRQFGTCVFFFDFSYITSNSLDSDVLISVF